MTIENLPKIVAAGTGVGLGALGLFLLLWFALAGVAPLMRVIISVITPLVILTIIVFGTLIVRQQHIREHINDDNRS